jgi:hypothetical protein
MFSEAVGKGSARLQRAAFGIPAERSLQKCVCRKTRQTIGRMPALPFDRSWMSFPNFVVATPSKTAAQ